MRLSIRFFGPKMMTSKEVAMVEVTLLLLATIVFLKLIVPKLLFFPTYHHKSAVDSMEMYEIVSKDMCAFVQDGQRIYDHALNPYIYRGSKMERNTLNMKLSVNQMYLFQPTFFKVILVENKDGSFELESFVIQNRAMDDNIILEAFHVLLESIERAAGFLIFDKVKSIKSVNEKKAYTNVFEKRMPEKLENNLK